MQKLIEGNSNLLNKDGSLAVCGYSTTMNVNYNRQYAKKHPFALKEWNFYQFLKGDYSIQLTLGHTSYACSVAVNVINIKNGSRRDVGVMKFFYIPKLDVNPQTPSLNEYKDKNIHLKFEVTETQRILTVKASTKQYKNVDVQVVAKNDVNNPKMVIATPFVKKKQFYLNYKENYYDVTGYVKIDQFELDLENAVGLLDWGRGVWPYRHEWFWGNATAKIDNLPVGFNIGWGFGDTSHATENIYFVDKKAYKVGELLVQRDKKNYMSPWHLRDSEDKINLTFTPTFDNYTQNKYVVIDTSCHQLYGTFDGYLQTENGKVEIKNLFAFIEHAQNKW